MAAGDVFSDMYTSTGTGGFDVQPAVGVSAMITYLSTSNNSGYFQPKNSSGSFSARSAGGDGSSTTNMSAQIGLTSGAKIFITNSEYFFLNTASGTQQFAYTGIEI